MVHERGLSPRVRGKLEERNSISFTMRSITACAGETRIDLKQTKKKAVYHRVCGGNFIDNAEGIVSKGLSPRVRGKPQGL